MSRALLGSTTTSQSGWMATMAAPGESRRNGGAYAKPKLDPQSMVSQPSKVDLRGLKLSAQSRRL